MNKYQAALDILSHISKNQGYDHCIEALQELVDKETSKKPIKTRCTNKCPRCKNTLPLKENALKKKAPKLHCDRCGQRIDWSKAHG